MANIDKIQPIGTSTQYDLTAQKVKYTSITSLSSFIDANGLIITSAGGNNTVTDKPENVDAFGCFTYKTASGWYGQLLTSSNAVSGLYWRTATALSGGWKKVLDSSNYSDYTVTKTGAGASGTWGISITGSAASATKASQDGDGNVITSTYIKKTGDTLTGALNASNDIWNKIGNDSQIGNINEAGTLGLQGLNGNTSIRFTTYNQSNKTSGGKITWDGTKFIITSTVETSISGNAATATTTKYLHTGNYAPTYGVNRLEYWNSNGTTGAVVANAVCYPTSDWYYFIRMNHNNANGYYVELASHFNGDNLYWRRVANGTAYDWKKVAWTDSDITGNAATATNADKVDGYHSSDLWRKDGGTWNSNTSISLQATTNNQNWSFEINKNSCTGTFWQINDTSLNALLKVTVDDGKVRAPYGFVGNLTGNADSATTAAALSSDAGSATVPVYFTNGKPTTCSTTLGVNISGNADTATKATQDSDGNQINTTYTKKSELLDLVYPIGAIYISVVNTSPAILFGGTWEQIEDTFLLSAGTNHAAGTTGGSETVTLTTAEMPAHTHAGPSHTHTGPSHTHGMQSHTHGLSSHYHWVGPQNGTANWVGLTGSVVNIASQSKDLYVGGSCGGICSRNTGGNASYALHGSYRNQAPDGMDGFTVNASHSHSVSTNAVNSGGPSNNTSGGPSNNTTTASGTGATGASGTGATSSTGSGGAHNNMPPYLTVYMWKRTA